MSKEEAQKRIAEITEFTCSYWWPSLEVAMQRRLRGETTTTHEEVILDIINKRSAYCEELRRVYLTP